MIRDRELPGMRTSCPWRPNPVSRHKCTNAGHALAAANQLSGFAGVEDLVRLSTAQLPEREDRGQVLRARARLALLPVVDRLRRRADQKAAFGCGQPQAATLRRQAPGAEASSWRKRVFVRCSRL